MYCCLFALTAIESAQQHVPYNNNNEKSVSTKFACSNNVTPWHVQIYVTTSSFWY